MNTSGWNWRRTSCTLGRGASEVCRFVASSQGSASRTHIFPVYSVILFKTKLSLSFHQQTNTRYCSCHFLIACFLGGGGVGEERRDTKAFFAGRAETAPTL